MKIGATTKAKGHVYECVATDSYENRRGDIVPCWILESRCADCGAPFTFMVGRASLRRRQWNRRCEDHKRPGVRAVPKTARPQRLRKPAAPPKRRQRKAKAAPPRLADMLN
jgi:hypothetical protein